MGALAELAELHLQQRLSVRPRPRMLAAQDLVVAVGVRDDVDAARDPVDMHGRPFGVPGSRVWHIVGDDGAPLGHVPPPLQVYGGPSVLLLMERIVLAVRRQDVA